MTDDSWQTAVDKKPVGERQINRRNSNTPFIFYISPFIYYLPYLICHPSFSHPQIADQERAMSPGSPPIILLWLGLAAFVAGGSENVGDPIRLTQDGREKQRPVWSRDGRWLAFARHEEGGSHVWQYVMEAGDPSSARRLTDRDAPDYDAAFLPDGERLLLATITLSGTQGNLDVSRIGRDGAGLTKVVGDQDGKLSHQDWPSPSPDGRRFAFSSTHDGNQEIYSADLDGSNLVRLSQSPGIDAHPDWSPDGERIVFATDRWGGLELATVKPDGTGLTRLTDSLGLDDYPVWSPDGTRLAWVSNRDGQHEVYVARLDGSDVRNLTQHPGRDTFPVWTADGRGVTFVSDRDGGADLYTIPLDD
jgi:Tol biopolymer transport system component